MILVLKRHSNKGMIYRDRDEIFYDILNVVRGLNQCSMRTVIYSCGLSYHPHKQYVTFLLSRDLLEKGVGMPSGEGYNIVLRITPKGLRYLQLFEKLSSQIRGHDRDSQPAVYIDPEDVAERYSKFREWRSKP